MKKVDEIDLNGNSTKETGQSEKEEVQEEKEESKEETKETKEESKESEVESEDVESLPNWAKSRLKKVEEERENLSKAVTRLNKERKLPSEEPKKEEDYPEWDDASKKFQEQTLSKVEKKAQEIIEKANEKEAINKFTSKHPGADWNYIVSNYSPTHGKGTVGDIVKDLERALVLARYETGELTELEKKAFKKGETEGKAKSAAADMASVGKTTAKTTKDKNSLSKGAIELAEKMRVNVKELAEEDDSRTAEIKF